MATRRRTRLSTGIYRDRFGIAIVISVRGVPQEFRADTHGQPYATRALDWLRCERTRRQAAAALIVERKIAASDTFAADVDRYLRTLASPQHRRNSEGYLKHWTAEFGTHQRNDITEMAIREHFASLNRKPSTLNHIRHALIAFYVTLNGRQGYNPARVLTKVRERYDDARALPYAVIEQIFEQLAPTPTKARLMVMAYTGLPPALIERITPHDLHLNKQAIYVRPRRKGAGVAGRTLPLSRAGVEAFRLFASLGAFGTFQRRQLQTTFDRGIKWANVSVPEGTRPYDLRHSFLTEVYRRTGDLRAVAELGMHATLEQTARYARAAVSERATKAVEQLPRIPRKANRGTGQKGSNSFHFGRVKDRQAQGGNQYRKRANTPDLSRKKRLTRS